MEIRDIKISIVDIPQVSPIAPYRSHIRSSSTTTSGIVEILTESGLTGLGELGRCHGEGGERGVRAQKTGGQEQSDPQSWLGVASRRRHKNAQQKRPDDVDGESADGRGVAQQGGEGAVYRVPRQGSQRAANGY